MNEGCEVQEVVSVLNDIQKLRGALCEVADQFGHCIDYLRATNEELSAMVGQTPVGDCPMHSPQLITTDGMIGDGLRDVQEHVLRLYAKLADLQSHGEATRSLVNKLGEAPTPTNAVATRG